MEARLTTIARLRNNSIESEQPEYYFLYICVNIKGALIS
jgi:hypothetical protein